MRPMDFELFKRMIDQAAALHIPELRPNGYGELLVLKDLDRYFDYLSSVPHRFRISINTNGNRMTDDKIELFLKHRVHSLNIVIDGATKATAETVRVGLDFDRIENNIHRLLKMRTDRGLKYPKVRVGMVLIDQNRHEASQFLRRWEGVADFVGLAGFSNRVGSLVQIGLPASPVAFPCVSPFSDLNIWADGKAVLCCEDWNEEHVIGDLQTQTIAEIWHGPRLADARRKHAKGAGCELAICAKCNNWQRPMPGVKLWV